MTDLPDGVFHQMKRALDTFFPEILELQGRAPQENVPIFMKNFLENFLKFFEFFCGRARGVKRHER